MNKIQRRRFSDLGLPRSQIDVLGALPAPESLGVTAADIARKLDCNPSAITRALDALEPAGYATRCRSTADKRRVYVFRTDLAERIMRGLVVNPAPALPTGAFAEQESVADL